MSTPHILIVDDDLALLEALPEALQLRLGDLTIDTADAAPAALERVATTDYDAIVSDIKMPGMDGLALLARIKELRPETPTLLITGHGEHDLAVQALRGGAYDFIQKPIDRDYFVASLRRAIQMRQLAREVESQRQALARHAATLEATVQARTHELLAANRAKEDLLALVRKQAAELDSIIEAIPDGVFVCDTNGQIIRVNASGAALLGMPREEALRHFGDYRHISALRHLDGTALTVDEQPLNRALHGETHRDFRLILRRFDTGEDIQIRSSCAPLRDDTGRLVGGVSVAGDITQLYQLEQQKDEFLGIASHELKTPLTTIKAMTQMTRRHFEREHLPMVNNLERIERAVVRMEKLVNDLVDSSRIEVGKLALSPEFCDVRDLCQHVVADIAVTTDRQLIFEAPATALEAEIDIDRISQVLANLISNAMKYSTPERLITLMAQRDDDEIVLSVRDQGTGIPVEEQEHIFGRFYRISETAVQAGSGVGLGLGLHICREIVARHEGRIWVESVVGQGSTFYVALPASKAGIARR